MKANMENVWILAAGIGFLMTGVSVFASRGTDARIEATARDSNVFKTYLKDDSIKVDAKDGFVTLTGTVSDLSHKDLAENTVENEAGVKSVSNKIVIAGGAANETSDAWVGVKVKTTLLSHRSVNGFRTQVDVRDGVVTLQGEASSSAQKELTTSYAENVEGVSRVINHMTVSPSDKPTLSEQIDDASITAQVKMMLLYHRSTSALNTGVKTKDGIVMVSGKAQNSAEIELVTRLVTDIHGVREVENYMTVSPGRKS